jgi:pimeloyl-ACP methyl ester carboxylesterase
VEIPGTHVWNPSTGSDPFDVTSCVHTLAGHSSAAGATVLAALRQAGASRDEPVLLAGHSLGGMTAAQLAADPAVRRSLHITHVVTAGAPVALSGVPGDVHVLSIEHSDDLVPRLDGAQNPDRPGWVTVSRPATDLPQPPGPGSEPSTADAHPRLAVTHDAAGYARTAARVDASADPSLLAYRAELTPFLDRPGATAVSWDVTGRRVFPVDAATGAAR